MSKVADRYRVVDTRARVRVPPWQVVPGVMLVGAALVVWTASDIRAFVVAKDTLPLHDALVEGTTRLEQISEAAGILALRRTVESWTQPIQHTAKVLQAPPEAPPESPLVEVAPVETDTDVDRLPGERWVGPEDPGGQKTRRILLVGASSIQYHLGIELERTLESTYPDLQVERLGKLGTGLVRDDVFDWKGQIQELQDAHHPQAVLLQFGGNDAQAFRTADGRVSFGTEEWDELYRNRLVELAGDIAEDGARPVFLGMPVMRDAGFSGRIERVNRVTQEAATIAGAGYVDTWTLASEPDRSYRVSVEHEGRRGTMRLQDGIHYSRLGARYVATGLAARLEQQLPMVTADPEQAVMVRREIDSAARGKRVPYVAYVPRDVPPEGLPALLLLHGAWDSYTAWADHAHRDLQRLATEHRVILVLPDGEPFGWYLDSDKVPGNRIATHLVDEVVPDLREHLPFDGRLSMAGLSMGGHGALVTALRHPGLALSVSSMSGAVDLEAAKSRKQLQELLGPYDADPDAWHAWSARHLLAREPEAARQLPIRLLTGDQDRSWTGPNRALHAQLEAAGVEHVWEEVPGGHTWEVWLAALPAHVAWHAARLHEAPLPPRFEAP